MQIFYERSYAVCYDMIWKNLAALILQFSSAFEHSMLSGILA